MEVYLRLCTPTLSYPDPMTFEIVSDYRALSATAAAWMDRVATTCSGALLCLASGQTPRGAYDRFADHPHQPLPRVLSLDEWAGLPPTSPYSSAYQLRTQLIDTKAATPGFLFDGAAPAAEETQRARAYLDTHGPIDGCVLGVGVNGHLGFNEPGPVLRPYVHVSLLSEESRQHPMIVGTGAALTHGITLGIADILQARQVLLVVSGAHKRPIMQQLRQQDLRTDLPVSMLWLHPAVHCICDTDAWGTD
ncbi:MAG: glucosamine-6-phosphate deaminase [Bacteroidia bacterium]